MRWFRLFAALLLGASVSAAVTLTSPATAADPAPAVTAPTVRATVYDVTQTFTVKDLPAGAKRVRVWCWMPEDRPGQDVLDFRIADAPEGTRVTRDPAYGRSWVYADVNVDVSANANANANAPSGAAAPRIVTKFSLRRRALSKLADPALAGPITDEHRRTFAKELRRDEKHMEVTPEMQKVADEICGAETNPVVQAKKIFDFVILKSDHYSKFGPTPQGKCLGDAQECMSGTGDCCTDQHALFITLARARGIPCRLIFGSRLRPQNEGKDHDPGYRCWPLFYAPGLGWVPLDISAADAASDDAEAQSWFGGLDDQRVEWAEGRDFELSPPSSERPDLVIRGWVEVDGKRHTAFDRVLHFTRR